MLSKICFEIRGKQADFIEDTFGLTSRYIFDGLQWIIWRETHYSRWTRSNEYFAVGKWFISKRAVRINTLNLYLIDENPIKIWIITRKFKMCMGILYSLLQVLQISTYVKRYREASRSSIDVFSSAVFFRISFLAVQCRMRRSLTL